jgi:sulfite exporter TauE/SafE
MSPSLFAAAFLMGLLGSTHCAFMCGGVVAMGCSAVPPLRRPSPRAQLRYHLGYNLGRITSYATAGAIAGAMGMALASIGAVERAQLALRCVAGAIMLAVGLYIAGVGPALRWVERAGAPLWRLVSPLARRLVPVRSVGGALALGLVWGWLPCGLVYGALAAAVATGSAVDGALTMLAFGLGTLPMLLMMSTAGALAARAAAVRQVRVFAGLVVVSLGVVQVVHFGYALVDTGMGRPHVCGGHRV